MTAGLFHAHGAWFGPCKGKNKINKKGFFESLYLKAEIEESHPGSFTRRWKGWMTSNGYDETKFPFWGAKSGPEVFEKFKEFEPLLVICDRPVEDIVASRARAGWVASDTNANLAYSRVRGINYPGLLKFYVKTAEIARGDYSSIEPVFRKLPVSFQPEIADEWVNPKLFHNG